MLGVAGGANIRLYPPRYSRVVQEGKNLFTQQVTHSNLPAAFKLCPKKMASQGTVPAKARAQGHLGVPFSGAMEKEMALQGQQRQLCDTGGDLPPPQSPHAAGFAEPPQTPEDLSALTMDH